MENLPDFEQRLIAKSAGGVTLRSGDKARQQARTHVGKIGGDRIGEFESGAAAAKSFRLFAGDE